MTTAEISARPETPTADRWGRVACAAVVPIALAAFAAADLPGDTGAEVTAVLVDDANLLMGAAFAAVFGAAALVLAAVRLGRRVGGSHGATIIAAGSAVAVLFVAYYGTFGAAGVVATQLLSEPGPGLGESALLLLNITEITRFAPGLVLVVAAITAGGRLPRAARVTAWVLAVMTVLPFTSWVAALLIPVWLGVTAASVSSRRS